MNTIVTPNGRFLGRKKDAPEDPARPDRRFVPRLRKTSFSDLKPRVDLRDKFPPAFDQGQAGSCGPNSVAAKMAFFFPGMTFSRLQIYADVRTMEGDFDQDGGVQTRDALQTLIDKGAAPEELWSYDLTKLFDHPPPNVYVEAAKYKLKSMARLVTAMDYLACLNEGLPFTLGWNVYESFDANAVAQHGVWAIPDPQREKFLGGHDTEIVGYDLHFKQSDAFKASGLAPEQVRDHALLVRNSWGTSWGWERGHVWMPLLIAIDHSTGDDAWVGRK